MGNSPWNSEVLPGRSTGREREPVQGGIPEVVTTVGNNQFLIPWNCLMNEGSVTQNHPGEEKRGSARAEPLSSLGPGASAPRILGGA